MVIHFYRGHIEHIVGYSGSTKFGGYHRYLIGECQEYKVFCNISWTFQFLKVLIDNHMVKTLQ